jgi:hypothetical protein
MERIIFGVGFVLVGAALIVFRRPLAKETVRAQNATWGFRMGERSARLGEWAYLLVGLVCLAFGTAALFGIGRF